jgi:hypothetical protein
MSLLRDTGRPSCATAVASARTVTPSGEMSLRGDTRGHHRATLCAVSKHGSLVEEPDAWAPRTGEVVGESQRPKKKGKGNYRLLAVSSGFGDQVDVVLVWRVDERVIVSSTASLSVMVA